MLKIETGEKKTVIGFSGTTKDICADFVSVIHHVYEGMKEENENGAEMFKQLFNKSIKLAFMDDDELEDELEEERKKSSKELDDKLKAIDIASTLKEAASIIEKEGSTIEDVIKFLDGKINDLEK